jgi:hypothetical protein
MVSQAEPACEESVPPVEPDALQMVGLQDPPDQAIRLVHNAPDEALTANNLNKENQCCGSGSVYVLGLLDPDQDPSIIISKIGFGICGFKKAIQPSY